MKDAAKVAAKWAGNLANATQSITDGINGVQVAPGQLAAAQSDVWIANTQAAKPKFEQRVQAVSLSEWKQASISKGVPRIADGASKAQPKMQAKMQQLLPMIENIRGQLPPRGSLAQNKVRMNQFIDAMAQVRLD